jgi:hypothetical protein
MQLRKINDGVYALHDLSGSHVGNFKWINGLWKFKAIGYDPHRSKFCRWWAFDGPAQHHLGELDEALIREQFFQD